ncbi:MAG: peptidase S41 [Sphingobacteriia bacterium]|nr:peptidase S41 [Sphingobacteriia bacterium]
MKKAILTTFLVAGTATILSAQQISEAQKAYIVSKFCTEVKYNFVHYNKLTFDWDSLCVAELPKLTATKTDYEFVQALQRLCVQLHDGHTQIYSGNFGSEDEWVRPLPFETKLVVNRVFVTNVYNSKFVEQGLVRGCEILEIDDEKVLDYADNHIRPYISYSTLQWQRMSSCRTFALTKDKGNKVTKIKFRTPDGKITELKSARTIDWDLDKEDRIFDYKVLGNNVGYLVINTFMGNNYKAQFDSVYKKIRTTEALIIDLRDNTGGNSSYADYIVRHLIDRPVRLGSWSTPMYIAAHASWNYAPEFYTTAGSTLNPITSTTVYKNPVVVLVNGATFSSAENFCVNFRAAKRGVIIGTSTGGSTGNPIQIKLSSDISCIICTKNELAADGSEFIGIGIKPDIEVEETADIFLKNQDVVIEQALKQIKNERQNSNKIEASHNN